MKCKACATGLRALHAGMDKPPWTRTGDGLLLAIRLTPRAHRDGVAALEALLLAWLARWA